jgi:hypothetical protein
MFDPYLVHTLFTPAFAKSERVVNQVWINTGQHVARPRPVLLSLHVQCCTKLFKTVETIINNLKDEVIGAKLCCFVQHYMF